MHDLLETRASLWCGQSQSRMPSDSPINVFVGCPQVLGRLPDGPCLIIDADASLAESIHRQPSVTTHDWPISVVPAIPTAVHHETIDWHRFRIHASMAPGQLMNGVRQAGS